MQTTVNNQDKPGFTAIPQDLLNALLVYALNQREIKVILLLIRLSIGCHSKWVQLRQCDLQVIGIRENHAKNVIKQILAKKIIIKNEKTGEFRLNSEFIIQECLCHQEQQERLGGLIGKQLKRVFPHKGNLELPQTGTETTPKVEAPASQTGKPVTIPKEEVPASDNTGFSTPKDILKDSKYSDIKEKVIANENI